MFVLILILVEVTLGGFGEGTIRRWIAEVLILVLMEVALGDEP